MTLSEYLGWAMSLLNTLQLIDVMRAAAVIFISAALLRRFLGSRD